MSVLKKGFFGRIVLASLFFWNMLTRLRLFRTKGQNIFFLGEFSDLLLQKNFSISKRSSGMKPQSFVILAHFLKPLINILYLLFTIYIFIKITEENFPKRLPVNI